MVKRDKGFYPVTHDWEFFELDVSKGGTEIRKRGFAEVVNRFGGNCFGCHIQARPQWDLVCEMDHGCAPIALTRAMSGALQRTDPRLQDPDSQPRGCRSAKAAKQTPETLWLKCQTGLTSDADGPRLSSALVHGHGVCRHTVLWSLLSRSRRPALSNFVAPLPLLTEHTSRWNRSLSGTRTHDHQTIAASGPTSQPGD